MMHFADLGFTRVRINFSGAGDSGDHDDPEFYKKDEDDGIEHEKFAKRRDKIDSGILESFKDSIHQITNEIEDWWNNDGGQGYIEVQIPSGEYDCEVSINHTETTDYSHSGTLVQD